MHQGLKSSPTDGEGGAKEFGNPYNGQNWLKRKRQVLYRLFDSKFGTYFKFQNLIICKQKNGYSTCIFSKEYEKN